MERIREMVTSTKGKGCRQRCLGHLGLLNHKYANQYSTEFSTSNNTVRWGGRERDNYCEGGD